MSDRSADVEVKLVESGRQGICDDSAGGFLGEVEARQVRELAELIGPEALSRTDRRYLDFDDAFARELVNQRPDEARELNSTLDRAWQVIRRLPERELVMLPTAMLAAHPDQRNSTDPDAG